MARLSRAPRAPRAPRAFPAPFALLALLAVPLAGCLAPGAPLADARLDGATLAPPHVEAVGAAVEVVGDAVRVTWQGVADPASALPVTDPRWPVPTMVQQLAVHELMLGADATLAFGELRWETGEDYLGFALRNATGALWCGAGAVRGEGSRCATTLHKARGGPEPWAVHVTGDPSGVPTGPIPYELSFVFHATPLLAQGPPVRAGTLAFGAPVEVHDASRAAEPSIAVTPGGTVYVGALPHAYGVWKSEAGGPFAWIEATPLRYCTVGAVGRIPPLDALSPGGPRLTHFGCGDIDVATSGEDTVWFSAHWGNEAVSVSQDAGATWTTNVLAAGADVHTDRQWLVTDGPLTAWHVQTSVMERAARGVLGLPGGDFSVLRTLDGGRTWAPVARPVFDAACVSTFARDVEGTLYLGSCDEGGPGVGVSTDGGLSWAWRPGPRRDALGFLIVQVTTDAGGNVYLVWTEPPAEGVGTHVAYAWSGDRGATWSAPRRVFTEPGTYALPWGTGGAAGHLAIAAYGTRFVGPAHEALGDWYPVVALTQDALSEAPTWHEAAVGAEPNQWGPICLGGNACAHGRNLADYFQVQADGAGMLHVAYARANPADGLRPGVFYARQEAGPGLGGPSVDKNGGA